jgi:hypothetical protein
LDPIISIWGRIPIKNLLNATCYHCSRKKKTGIRIGISVEDSDPEPDPYDFWPPGSELISKRYGTGTFSHKFVKWNEILPAEQTFSHKIFSKKLNFFD